MFGEQNRFGIEVGNVQIIDSKPMVQCRFWMAGERLGDWDDRIFLRGSLEYATLFVRLRHLREQSGYVEGDANEVFEQLYEYYYSDNREIKNEIHDVRDIFHLEDIGMSSLLDKYGIVLAPDDFGGMRLISKRFCDNLILEQRLAKGEVERVLDEYIASYSD